MMAVGGIENDRPVWLIGISLVFFEAFLVTNH